MADHFEDYRAFDSLETARAVLLNLLEKEEIPYVIYHDVYRQDVILGSPVGLHEYWVRVRPEDFTKVNDLLLAYAEEMGEEDLEVDYLNELSAEELIAVLKKPDLWGVSDYVTARKILAHRGIDIPDNVLNEWKEARHTELKEEEREEWEAAEKASIGDGTFIKRGYYVSNAAVVNKTTGERDYLYDQKERRKARLQFILGITLLLVAFIGWILYLAIKGVLPK